MASNQPNLLDVDWSKIPAPPMTAQRGISKA